MSAHACQLCGISRVSLAKCYVVTGPRNVESMLLCIECQRSRNAMECLEIGTKVERLCGRDEETGEYCVERGVVVEPGPFVRRADGRVCMLCHAWEPVEL